MLFKIDKKWFFLPIVVILSALLAFQPVISYANTNKVEKEESVEVVDPVSLFLEGMAGAAFTGAVSSGLIYGADVFFTEREWDKEEFIDDVIKGACIGMAIFMLTFFNLGTIAVFIGISQDAVNIHNLAEKLKENSLKEFFNNSLASINSMWDAISGKARTVLDDNQDEFIDVIDAIVAEPIQESSKEEEPFDKTVFRPAVAEFLTYPIYESGLSVVSNTMEYSKNYGGSYVMKVTDSNELTIEFILENLEREIILNIVHKTPSGGYSPVDISLNGKLIADNFDPANNNVGKHSFVQDIFKFSINDLKIEKNTLSLKLDTNADTDYWIKGLSLAPGSAEGNFVNTLSTDDFEWDDEDDDGVIEANESDHLKINLTSDSDIDNVRAVLKTTDSSIIITDSDTFYQNGIKAGVNNWPDGWFSLKFNFDNEKSCNFTLHLTYEKDGFDYYQDIDFDQNVLTPADWVTFDVDDIVIDDPIGISSNNNVDGHFQSGERVLVGPIITNTSETNATKIDVTLIYEGEDEYIIISGDERYPDKYPGESASPNNPFRVEAIKDFSGDVNIKVIIECEENESPFVTSLQLTVEPQAWFDLSDNEWNFGTVKPGTDVTDTRTISNYGTKAMAIQSFEISHDDTYIDTTDLPWTINPGESRNVEITISTEGLMGDIDRSIKFLHDGRTKEPDVDNWLIINGSVSITIAQYPIPNTAGGDYPDISGNIIVWRQNSDILAYDISTKTPYDICTDDANQSRPRISGKNIVWQDIRNWSGSGDVVADIYGYNLDTKQEYSISIDSKDKDLLGIDGSKVFYTKQYYTFTEASYKEHLCDLWMYDINTNAHTNITNYSGSDNPKKTVEPDDADVCDGLVVWSEETCYLNTTYNKWSQGDVKVFSMSFTDMIPNEIGIYRSDNNLKTNGSEISWSFEPDGDEMWIWEDGIIEHWQDENIDYKFPVLGDNYLVFSEKRSGQPKQLKAMTLDNEEELLVTESEYFIDETYRMDDVVLVWKCYNPSEINYSYLDGSGPPPPVVPLKPVIDIAILKIEFGSVSTGDSHDDNFIISNKGDGDLIISSIESLNTAFEVDPDSITISPGSNKNVKITFTPPGIGLIKDFIIITSNDTTNITKTIDVSGTGIESIINVSPQTIEFNESIIGFRYSDSFTINNTGNVELIINSISSDNEVYKVDKNSATIAPDSTIIVNVTYTPSKIGEDNGTITLIHADDKSTYVSVSGSARLLKPPSNIQVKDVPDDHGHSVILTWSLSPDDSNISYYNIYRSQNKELTETISLESLNSLEELIEVEQYHTILIDSVAVSTTDYIDKYVPLNNVLYYYWVQAVSSDGVSKKIAANILTNVNEKPSEFHVNAPYPNPFNPSVTIEYMIPQECRVKIVIYDILGREVKVLQNNVIGAGIYSEVWDGKNKNGSIVGSGVYIYRLKAGNYINQGKILFLR